MKSKVGMVLIATVVIFLLFGQVKGVLNPEQVQTVPGTHHVHEF
jgi:hypothetical protein